MSTNKEIIEKVNAAFSGNKMGDFYELCSENIEWTMAGDKTRNGISAVRDFMESMGDGPPPTFVISDIISDGASAACYGTMTIDEKGTPGIYQFSDLYRFEDGKITDLTSFMVKQRSETAANK